MKTKPFFQTPSSIVHATENVENPFVIVKKIENISPQDGRQMVDVDLISTK
jgi:hypothetical protein